MSTPRQDAGQDTKTVGDIMTGDLISLRPIDPVSRARSILIETGLHALPLIERGEAVGMITLADCEGRPADELLGHAITGPPVTIDVGATIAEAAGLMQTEYIHHLIVTEAAGDSESAVGILSTYDLLAILAD